MPMYTSNNGAGDPDARAGHLAPRRAGHPRLGRRAGDDGALDQRALALDAEAHRGRLGRVARRGREIAPSDATFDELTVVPAKVAGLTIICRELANDSSPRPRALVGDSLKRRDRDPGRRGVFGNLAAPAPKGLGALADADVILIGTDHTGLEAVRAGRERRRAGRSHDHHVGHAPGDGAALRDAEGGRRVEPSRCSAPTRRAGAAHHRGPAAAHLAALPRGRRRRHPRGAGVHRDPRGRRGGAVGRRLLLVGTGSRSGRSCASRSASPRQAHRAARRHRGLTDDAARRRPGVLPRARGARPARAVLLLEGAEQAARAWCGRCPTGCDWIVLDVAANAYSSPPGPGGAAGVGPFSGQVAPGGVFLSKRQAEALRRLAGRGAAFTIDTTPASVEVGRSATVGRATPRTSW